MEKLNAFAHLTVEELQRRGRASREKKYAMLKHCMVEYEESIIAKPRMNDINDITPHAHGKLLGYISECINQPFNFTIKTPYEEVVYNLQQHELLKQWIIELESDISELDHPSVYLLDREGILSFNGYYNGGCILHYYEPDKQKWNIK
jgi:hypothetical protein